MPFGAGAQTNLADQPLFASVNPPGNMSLALSVEYPTAVSVAHTNRNYASATQYLGYFDPDKCYTYLFTSTDSTATPANSAPASYFVPSAKATAHLCNQQWSGNFLNWSMMQTIDTFRWVMTGGYRVIDQPDKTVLEKAWASGQGGNSNFPESFIAGSDIAGATPFGSLNGYTMKTRIYGLGNRMRFLVSQTLTNQPLIYKVDYFNNTDLSNAPTFTSNGVVGTSAIVGGKSPAPGVGPDNWSSRHTSTLTIPVTGVYTFQTVSDDGARLYLNGNRVIDDWPAAGHSATAVNSAAMTFNAGDVVALILEYREFGRDASLTLNWQPPGGSGFTEIGSTDFLGGLTPYDPSKTASAGTTYEVFTRAKVCDPTVSLESNCKSYSGSAKPEGLMQQYSDKLRFSVFGYLNDGDLKRDGGVLRARQKFIGPTKPVYGSAPLTNPAFEWDASTGVLVRNPDTSDATATGVSDSGALNYVSKFGEAARSDYKGNDPVSELFYAVVRYFRNIGNVPEWTDVSNLTAAQQKTAVDGFPVITNWDDPIIYSCQKNFILGIGDVNTHADKNVPGNTNTSSEPVLPTSVANDPSQYLPYDQRLASGVALTPYTSTDMVGKIELASGGSYNGATRALSAVSPYGGCCDNNTAVIAGIAYDIHTTGIRPFDTTKGEVAQTIDTYWVDVLEGQIYKPNNQYWLATKYGGFTVPTGYKAYPATTPVLTDASWTNGDLIGGQKRPRNYFSGGDPATMQKGLIAAFADAASKLPVQFSTSLSTSSAQVASSGTGSYASSYAAANWSGEVSGSSLTFDPATGNPTPTQRWLFNAILTAQGPNNRRIASWDGTRGVRFAASGPQVTTPALSVAQLAALRTGFVAGDDSANYLAYLRGDRSLETSTTITDPARVYRARNGLLGDIVNSKPVAVGPPAFPYAEATNPGYTKFRADYATRRTVVYVGANDGMLHAINGALLKTTDPATTTPVERDDNAGTEMFAYVPAALFAGPSSPATKNVNGLESLGNPSFIHHYMVDASASAYDVDFANTDHPVSTSPDWHTILVGGLGKGGRSYYAIDITDPQAMVSGGESTVAAKVLWEYGEPQSLGYTYGEPIVAKTRKYGWVVILPSGYNNGDGNGHLIVLNPRNGALLQKIDLGTSGAGNGLAHANAFIVDSTDGTVDSVYAGDLNGNVWRVDMTSATATSFPSVQLATLKDAAGNGQPITVRPALKVDPTTAARRRFVMVGTGRLLDNSDIASTQAQSFYAILDGSQSAFNATATNGIKFPVGRSGLANVAASLTGTAAVDLTTKAGYYFDFASDPTQGTAASRMTVEPSTFYNSVSLVTSQPNGNICAPSGSSNFYGLDIGKAQSFLQNASGMTVANFSFTTTATDVRIFSNNGTAVGTISLSGGDSVTFSPLKPGADPPRRVNWREVPSVE